MSALDALVAGRLARVRDRIASAGGDPDAVRVVAVTKGFGPDAVLAALRAGITDIGENYAHELLRKAEALSGEPGAPVTARWHFLGQIQRNKVGRLAPVVSCWQGLDRLEEGEAIARAAPGAAVLVEVATTSDPARGGVVAPEVPRLVEALAGLGLDVRGAMTVAPAEPGAAEVAFATLRRLVEDLGLGECSMGMSSDLELAVRHGTTMVRVGQALFGPRPAPAR